MATAQLDYILQNFDIYVDGFGKAGSGETCELPKIEKDTQDFRGGGMRGTRQMSLGYKPMRFKSGFSASDPQVLGKAGLDVDKRLAFSVRAYMSGDQDRQHTAVVQMRGEVLVLDQGKWEAGKKAMLSMETSIDYYRLVIDGTEVWNIDIENNVYTARNGTDFGAAMAAALGF